MKKKILIGSIIAVVLLLLMPSIPAIQTNSIEEGFKQDIQEKLDTNVFMNVNGLKRLFEDDFWDHPIIYFLGTVAAFRALRGLFLLMLSSTWDYWGGIEMKNPIIFIRAVWLLGTGFGFSYLLQTIAYIMGWEW